VSFRPDGLISIGGRARRLEDVLQPLSTAAPGTSTVDMTVATTRRPSDKSSELYSCERGTAISLDDIVVSIPLDRNRKVGEVQWPSHLPANPEKEFAVLDQSLSCQTRAAATLPSDAASVADRMAAKPGMRFVPHQRPLSANTSIEPVSTKIRTCSGLAPAAR